MFIFLVVTWVRWSFVRIRVDQILAISWKLLLPISLILLLATAFVVAVAERRCRLSRTSFLGETWQLVTAVRRAMGVTLRNLFRKPITVQYPTVKRVYPDRFRGILALAYEKDTGEEACIGCRLCEFICPPQVIKVEMLKAEKRNYAKTFTLELYAVRVLRAVRAGVPDRRHHHARRPSTWRRSDRREMLLDKDRLHALGLGARALVGHRQPPA